MPILSKDDQYKLRKLLRCNATTDYLHDVYNQPLFISKLKSAIKMLKAFHKSNTFDAIAFCGHSGAAFAFPISFALNIPAICVRKRGELTNSHCDRVFEGIRPKKYIIIDDRICDGNTIKRIVNEINAEIDAYNEDLKWQRRYNIKNIMKHPELLAIFLYSDIDPYRYVHNGIPVFHVDYGEKERRLVSKSKKI